MRLSVPAHIFLVLCVTAACIANDQSASVVNSSCSISMNPSEAKRSVTQTALLACTTVLQPTGALEWLIDVEQMRFGDVLDGGLVHAVEPPSGRASTLTELVRKCWPSSSLRIFFSREDRDSHSQLCELVSIAAADALHSPLLGIVRVFMSVDGLPALPTALAASVLPHVTVVVVLLFSAPGLIVIAPLWSLAALCFAVIDLCHTPVRAAAALRYSKHRLLMFFLRRLFARIVMALLVAAADVVAVLVSASTSTIT
jgi:hypothetical protein